MGFLVIFSPAAQEHFVLLYHYIVEATVPISEVMDTPMTSLHYCLSCGTLTGSEMSAATRSIRYIVRTE